MGLEVGKEIKIGRVQVLVAKGCPEITFEHLSFTEQMEYDLLKVLDDTRSEVLAPQIYKALVAYNIFIRITTDKNNSELAYWKWASQFLSYVIRIGKRPD